MSSTITVIYGSSFRVWILTIIILCAAIWWASADTLAQKAALVPLKMTAHSALRSLEELEYHTALYLAIAMADWGYTSSYGSLRPARNEAANPSARNAILRTVGPLASVNSANRAECARPVMSSLFEPTAGVRDFTDLQAEGSIQRQILQSSSDQARAKMYTLLDDGPPPGPSRYGYRMKYFLSKQWLADSESITEEKSSSARIKNDAISTINRQAAVIILLISASHFPHGD